jgi:hypothetical protein
MSIRRIFSPAIEKHPRDPGANPVIGRHRFEFVPVTFQECRRRRRQPWTKPGLKKKQWIYPIQEFVWDTRHHSRRRLDEQISFWKDSDLRRCVEVPQRSNFAPAGANLSPVVGNKQALPAGQREKREFHFRNGPFIFKDRLKLRIVPGIRMIIVCEIQAHFHRAAEARDFHCPIKIAGE